jgi:repressor LexA
MAHTPPGRTRERVFRFVRDRLLAGAPPTVREVQEALGFRAVESARAQLAALVAGGRLVKEAGRKSRGYRLPAGGGRHAAAPPPVLVPVLGRVQAGALTTALEEPDGYVAVQSRLAPGELFALHVRGESMTGAGIWPGDIVIVRRQPTAEHGDIVVALVEDEATVKRLRIRQGRCELHPENPAFAPIVPPPESEGVRLLGKVVELRRVLDGRWTAAVPG